MTKDQKQEFRDFILAEMNLPPSETDPIRVVRDIAAHSNDVRAQLMAIRMLARELGAVDPPTQIYDAKWKVIRVGPGDPGHVDTQPTEADAA